jgi:Heterokaryon incompatibility protein (HET)
MKTIRLNGKDYEIQQNLFDALSSLRYETWGRTLWIDAICINQEDVKERNHQVSRMASIYSQANAVVVWLGQPDEGGDGKSCVEALRFLGWYMVEKRIDHFVQKELELDWGLEVLQGLQTLSLKSYWTRLWVVQEALLASQAIVQCGPYWTLWDSLKYVCQSLQSRNRGWNERLVQLKHATMTISASRMNVLLAGRPGKLSSNLSYLCWLHGKAECENEIDKIFGLWALASDCCQQAVPIDYSASFDRILRKLLTHDIAAHGMPAESAADVNAFKQQLFGRYGP